MEPKIVKRLHISGLTPQISSSDLSGRFSSFGTVKALDGLGKLDAVGLPRRYAYITLESTKEQLAKCLNVLSGTTWKGAKLRIGEAKPDFYERIAKEREENLILSTPSSADARPRKRRRLARGCQGVHAADMSIVTASTYSARAGWRKTPLGRLIRPMRMRPLRPLVESAATSASKQQSSFPKKKKTKRNGTLVRARRRLIDPEEWGCEYLKGVMLESGSDVILPEKQRTREPVSHAEGRIPDIGSENQRFEQEQNIQEDETLSLNSSTTPPNLELKTSRHRSPSATSPKLLIPDPPKFNALTALSDEQSDLTRETSNSLAFLQTLFGNVSEGNDWGYAESLSDIDIEEASRRHKDIQLTEVDNDNDEIEIVSRESHATKRKDQGVPIVDVPETVSPGQSRNEQTESQQTVQVKKLKDIFVPRAEDASFSILKSLDIDLDLDDTFDPPTLPLTTQLPDTLKDVNDKSYAPAQPKVQFVSDPSKLLFFPLSLSENGNPVQPYVPKGKAPRDIFDLAREKGWLNQFCQKESSEEVRKRWEESKVALTRDWKTRHREAVKNARRRGVGVD